MRRLPGRPAKSKRAAATSSLHKRCASCPTGRSYSSDTLRATMLDDHAVLIDPKRDKAKAAMLLRMSAVRHAHLRYAITLSSKAHKYAQRSVPANRIQQNVLAAWAVEPSSVARAGTQAAHFDQLDTVSKPQRLCSRSACADVSIPPAPILAATRGLRPLARSPWRCRIPASLEERKPSRTRCGAPTLNARLRGASPSRRWPQREHAASTRHGRERMSCDRAAVALYGAGL